MFPVLGESLLWFLLIGTILWFVLNSMDTIATMQSLGPIAEIAMAAILIPFALFVAWAVAIMRRSAFRPTITVDGFGITRRSSGQEKPVNIPWQSITAWVVVPPAPATNRPTRYVIFGDGHKITWAEPVDAQLAGRDVKGDRRQAYHALAERIHALIAARTGQPLRELRVDAAPITQV